MKRVHVLIKDGGKKYARACHLQIAHCACFRSIGIGTARAGETMALQYWKPATPSFDHHTLPSTRVLTIIERGKADENNGLLLVSHFFS